MKNYLNKEEIKAVQSISQIVTYFEDLYNEKLDFYDEEAEELIEIDKLYKKALNVLNFLIN